MYEMPLCMCQQQHACLVPSCADPGPHEAPRRNIPPTIPLPAPAPGICAVAVRAPRSTRALLIRVSLPRTPSPLPPAEPPPLVKPRPRGPQPARCRALGAPQPGATRAREDFCVRGELSPSLPFRFSFRPSFLLRVKG